MPIHMLNRIEASLADLAPRGVMIGYHVRFSRPVRRICTYPSGWITDYTRLNMIVADPSVIWCVMNEGALRWSDLVQQVPDPMNVMGQAAAVGMTHGVSISCGLPESRTVMGAARSDREFTDAEIARMQTLLRQGHDLLDRATAMRPILVEALEAIACGMTYDQACAHLGISRTALRYRLHTARASLGVDDNPEAIRKAIDLGLLSSNSYAGMVKGLPEAPSPM
ncbi:autoinducer binding domain-containing protein [Paracoccus sp. R86501]|uniref:autoinducer binding domain-containing protein n=1 Tax=Paracoccus sp. R86501 TaxID=3101711 RepID=UPI00366AAB1A